MGWYPMPEQVFEHPEVENAGWEYCDEGTCDHKDCELYWEDRKRPCEKCGELIKPGTARYFTEGKNHQHFICFHS